MKIKSYGAGSCLETYKELLQWSTHTSGKESGSNYLYSSWTLPFPLTFSLMYVSCVLCTSAVNLYTGTRTLTHAQTARRTFFGASQSEGERNVVTKCNTLPFTLFSSNCRCPPGIRSSTLQPPLGPCRKCHLVYNSWFFYGSAVWRECIETKDF